MIDFERRARRNAAADRRDAEAMERAKVDARVDAAADQARTILPGGIGAALADVLEAMKPFRASDGHLSFRAVGRSSPEVIELAEALLAVPSTGDDRVRLQPSFWAAPSNVQSRICDLCGALVPEVKPVLGSMPDARAAHRRWHANHPDYREEQPAAAPNCRFCGEPESATVWCCDARMEASEQGEG